MPPGQTARGVYNEPPKPGPFACAWETHSVIDNRGGSGARDALDGIVTLIDGDTLILSGIPFAVSTDPRGQLQLTPA